MSPPRGIADGTHDEPARPLGGPSACSRSHRLSGDGEWSLVLAPRLGRLLWAVPFLGVGLGALGLAVAGVDDLPRGVSSVFFGTVGLALIVGGFAAIFAPGRVVFDRLGRTVRWRRGLSRGACPFSDVVAVQIVAGCAHEVEYTERNPPRVRRFRYVTDELNLIVADPRDAQARSRRNLTNHTDSAWTRSAAERIAAFLGVPLIVQAAEGPAPSDVRAESPKP